MWLVCQYCTVSIYAPSSYVISIHFLVETNYQLFSFIIAVVILCVNQVVYTNWTMLSCTGCFKKSSPPPKTFWNIFIVVKSFCMKICNFVGNLCPHMSVIFCTFILKFYQMVLIFPRVPMVFTVSSFEYWMHMLREQGLGEKAIISSDTLTKGGSWALVRKFAIESTTLAQPFCVNQTVGLGDLPQHLHAQFVILRQFSHWYFPKL